MAGNWTWPVSGFDITQGFSGAHRGLDLAAPLGTPVMSPTGGSIESAGWNDQGYGNLVIVRTLEGMRVLLAHLRSIANLRPGQNISAGDPIGALGSTGNSTGPHLHLEVRDSGNNPIPPNDLFGGETRSDRDPPPQNPPGPPAGLLWDAVASPFVGEATQSDSAHWRWEILQTPVGPVGLTGKYSTTWDALVFAVGAVFLIMGLIPVYGYAIKKGKEDANKTRALVEDIVPGGKEQTQSIGMAAKREPPSKPSASKNAPPKGKANFPKQILKAAAIGSGSRSKPKRKR